MTFGANPDQDSTLAFDVRPEVAEQIESMGAEFVYLDFAEAAQDGAATGGYAAPSSPEFREAQLKKFRELAPGIDIEQDILAHMAFKPMIHGQPRLMDARIFHDSAMGLR